MEGVQPTPPATLDEHTTLPINEYTLNFYGNGITPIKLSIQDINVDKITLSRNVWEPLPKTLESYIDRSAKSTASLICKRQNLQSKYNLLIQHLNTGTFPPYIRCKIITHIKQNTDELQKNANLQLLTADIISTATKHNQVNIDILNMLPVLLQDLYEICKLDILRNNKRIPFTDCKENLFIKLWHEKISQYLITFNLTVKQQEDAKLKRKQQRESKLVKKQQEITTRNNAAIAAGISNGKIETIDHTTELQQQVIQLSKLVEKLQLKVNSGNANGGGKSYQPPKSKGITHNTQNNQTHKN